MNGREGGGGQAPPADLFKWQATVNANPLSVMVRTAKKCLGSSDWETAYTELRFNRAMQRVEQLKSEGRWSFRQPKKQKGPPLAKSHWDWMLEEMKWLQTDFREERRWKVALAYEMSQWVLDWHDAKDKSEVCGRVGTGKFTSLSSSKEEGIDADGDAEMEEEQDGFGAGVSEERREVGEEENDDVEMDASKESAISSKKKIHHPSQLDGIDSTTANLIINSTTANDTTVLDEEPVDNLSATVESQAAVEEALDDLESKMTDEARDESDDPLHLAAAASSKKSTESNGVDGEGAVDEDEDADGDGEMDADGDGEVEMLDIIPEAARSSTNPEITGEVNLGEIVPPELPIEDAKPLAPLKTANNDPLPPSSSNGEHPSSSSAAPALKAGSTNPTLTSNDGGQLVEADELDAEERLRTARSTLLQLSPTSLTFDLWAFSLPSSVPDQPQPHPDSSLENANLDEDPSSDPPSIPSTSTLDAHLFSDLLGDVSAYSMPLPLSDSAILSGRIDRRIDEATVSGGKLAHTSRLLDIRPVLVSTLQPGKKRKGDEWEDLGDLWGANESGDYGEPRGEVVSWGTCSLFARKKSKESVHPPTCVKPSQPRNYEIRLSSTIWQNDDDIVLQRLCHQFPFNWQLISDAFNTSRRTLSIDRRSPWDCWQRWNKKWNPNPEKEVDKKDGATSEPGMVDGGEGGASSPGGTVLAAAAVSKKGEKGKMVPAILDPKFEGSKKKLRHAKLYEAMRKTAKRRDLTNRKPNLKEPRRVLTAHESHNQYISSRIGGPTPADLSQHKWERDKAYNEAQRAATEQRDIAFRRYQQGLANQQGGSRQGGSGTPPGGQQGGQQQHQNQGNRPPGYQNGPNQQHSQLTPQQQQQFQQNAVHQQRLAALAASQNGGGGPSNGSGGGVDRQLQLLQAQRNNQGRGPNQQQQQQHGQQQQQMHPSRAPGVGGGGPDRKSSRANSDSPSMQAAGISRPGSSGPGGGLSFQGARGDTPAEIAQSLVATVPAEICAKLDKVLTINGHSVTPQLIQAALANKVRVS
ncbi:hypothetical protein BDY24DRAFT_136851 [Mrakia frigida]|uniref:Eaf1p n=1 Tax=Mrakia frigida TaxID=29902 RepID=UPI003FCC14A4